MKPTLQALVLADHVYVDGATGKKIIAGTFNALGAPAQFPGRFERHTYAYLSVTNVEGKSTLTLRFVDLKDNSVVMQGRSSEVTFPDRLRSTELIIPVPPFPMPHPGMFAFEVWLGDEPIGSLRIEIADSNKGEA